MYSIDIPPKIIKAHIKTNLLTDKQVEYFRVSYIFVYDLLKH